MRNTPPAAESRVGHSAFSPAAPQPPVPATSTFVASAVLSVSLTEVSAALSVSLTKVSVALSVSLTEVSSALPVSD